MHRHFDEQILDLLQRITLMGRLAEDMIGISLKVLTERNERFTDEVRRKEEEVNRLQIEIDDRAIKLTALQQPVGSDVRFLFMASRIATDLERIADLAVDICQSGHELLKEPPLKPLVDLPIMADTAQHMVRDGLEALVGKDCVLAENVFKNEEKVDALRNQIFRELLTYMMSDPKTVSRALSLILVSRHLERIGDHATNIAEEVIYLVKGRDVRHPEKHHRAEDGQQ